jgi:hypothetical protein
MDTPQRPPCDSVGPPGQPVIAEMGLDMSRFPDPAGAGVLGRAHPDRAAVRAPQEPREEGARQHLRQAGRSGRLHRREHGYVPRRALPPPAPAAAGGRRPAAPWAGPSSDGTEHSPTNAGDACPLRPPGQRHALPDRRPSHQRTRRSPPTPPRGKPPGRRTDTRGCTLDSAARVKPEHATGAARPWPSVKQPTVRIDRFRAPTPSAIRPWTPRHSGRQRYKVTRDGTEQKRPA